mmetsp:Transcript_8838/g.12101  ORF Transcript_8838/g.12101 Transcript_8838/m.12101 type:complete len:112 (+) Transcript_8838:2664-2999(+)
MEGIPASMAVLGMRLGEHGRKNSDGKSSMMGLSALGLESHRESLGEPELALDEPRVALDLPVSAREGIDDASLQSTDRETRVHDILELMIASEIEQALGIMIELEHPNVVE